MIQTVLVAMDDSPLAEEALRYALDVFPQTTIVVLHVADMEYDMATYDTEEVELAGVDELGGVGDERAQDVFASVRSVVSDTGDATDADVRVTFLVGKPKERIVDYVTGEDVDQTVMGTHAREGVSRMLLGSVAEAVTRRTQVPTTLVK